MPRSTLIVGLALTASLARADQAPITIDGAFDDWASVPVAWTDAAGDGGAADFLALRLADDERFLFLRLETAGAYDLSELNDVRLHLDTDANAATGIAINGIGAELQWRAGDRQGTFVHDGVFVTVFHEDIRFRSGPTVTSTVFEIAVGRDTLPDGANPLFTGDEVRIVITDGSSGDMLPDAGQLVSYTLDVGSAPPVAPRTLDRRRAEHVRVMTHNVLSGGPFIPQHAAAFQRLYTAVAPDVLCLQEINFESAAETRDLIAGWLGEPFDAAKWADCITVSRFPILDTWAIDGNLAALLDTTALLGAPTLCINAHLPCCANESARQDEADAIAAFIRDAYDPDGLALAPDVPVILAGDLNLVGFAQQLDTLLTGDIQDEATHGPDHPPDPDGTALTSTISRQTEKRMGYTWRNDFSSFWPGHLDYLIYSDSNVRRRHDFIVYTPEMSPAQRAAYGLLLDDSLVSDHLVFCADFAPPCASDLDGDGSVGFADLLLVLTAWGPCNAPCGADVDDDGAVGFTDLLLLLSQWGECA